MAVHTGTNHEQVAAENAPEMDAPSLSMFETRPGRRVLTEDGNTDAWIATDLTVDVTE